MRPHTVCSVFIHPTIKSCQIVNVVLTLVACVYSPAAYWMGVGMISYCSYHMLLDKEYRICSRNLRTFFSILAVEKSGCVKYVDFFCGGLDLGFILV